MRMVVRTATALLVLAGAAALRFARLGERPIHADEAVQAVKLGHTLETGHYVYDPREYHGPALIAASLPVAFACHARSLADLSEPMLRAVPAAFGLLLVALTLLAARQLGWPAALSAAAFTALSPACIYYSRYYIAETLLVCFSFAAVLALWSLLGYASTAGAACRVEPSTVQRPRADRPGASFDASEPRASHRPAGPNPTLHTGSSPTSSGRHTFRLAPALTFGCAVGLMYATKETWLIAAAAMLLAAGCSERLGPRCLLNRIGNRNVVAALVAAAVISTTLYTWLLTNRAGLLDSITAYWFYLQRASAAGQAAAHRHPWFFYFQALLLWPSDDHLLSLEWPLVPPALLALVAAVACLLRGAGGSTDQATRWLDPVARRPAGFLAVYTASLTGIYCLIPYKTPWCALGFLHGWILLAGIGLAAAANAISQVWSRRPGRSGSILPTALTLASTALFSWPLARNAYWANFTSVAALPANPYAYAHTSTDVPILADRVLALADTHPDRHAMHLQVVVADHQYWPLPWYLRRLQRTGWYAAVPTGPPAPAIIAEASLEEQIANYLYLRQPPGQRPLYVPVGPDERRDYWLLRPAVPLRLYVRLDLLQSSKARRPKER